MKFEVLGELQIALDDGSLLSLTSSRQRAVLAMLLMADGHPVGPDRLIEAVWGDALPANPSNTLQQTVTQLRKVLEPERDRADEPTVLLSSEGGYRLAIADHEVDSAEFERLLDRAGAIRADSPAKALEAAEGALSIWRGSLAYADVSDVAAVEGTQRRLGERRVEALELAADCRMVLEGPEAVIPELENLTTEFPHRDGLWAQLMTALYRSGRQADALRAFQRASDAAGDLGLVVSPALRDVEQQVLLQDEGLAPAERRTVLSNLPAAKNRLIGRENELIDLSGRLERSRLVTITGPGGSGKTELALELARRRANENGSDLDAVWLVRLDQLRDPDLLGPSIAAAVGMPESPGLTVTESLASYLGDRPVLLILDNCEHLIDPVSDLASVLLDRCAGLAVLATSQVALALAGEQRVPLSPLAVPGDGDDVFTGLDEAPAVQLFIERAEQVDSMFAPSDADLRAIVNIVTFLEGLPLAIELAAARTRTLSPVELARLLHQGIELLSVGPRDAPERQRTLISTIDWSYNLLRADERRALQALSVFGGGFDTEAAAAVMGADELVAGDMIDQLVASSIVTRDDPVAGRTRFRLLQTIRQFATDKAEATPDDLDRARRSHAVFFAEKAVELDRALIGADQADAFATLVADEDNYRLAMARSLDRQADRNDDLDRAEALAPGLTIAARLGRFWDWRGDLAEASTWLQRFTAAAGTSGGDLWLAVSWDAFFASELGQLDRAGRSSERAAELAGSSDEPYLLMAVTSGQALRSRLAGDPNAALEQADRLGRLADDIGDNWWAGLSHNMRALAYLDLGDIDQAAAAASISHRLFESVGDRRAVGWVLTASAQIELKRGNHPEAADLADRAAEASIEAGDGRNAGWALQIGAEVATTLGDQASAAELTARAEAVLEARGMASSPWANR